MVPILKTGLRAALKNWISLLLFVITYKVVGFTLVLNITDTLRLAVLRVLGLDFLGYQDLRLLFQSPPAVLLLLAGLLLFFCYVYLEVVALFLYCEAGWQSRAVSVWWLWKNAFLHFVSFFRPQNLPILLAGIPLLLLSAFPLTYGFMGRVRIPEFILEYIYSSQKLHLVFLVFMLLLNLFSFLFLFCLPAALSRGKQSPGPLRAGLRLLKGRMLKTAAALLVCLLAFALFALACFFAAVALLWLCSKLALQPDGGKSFFGFYFVRWRGIGAVFFSALLPVSLYAAVVTLYHRYRGDEPAQANKPARGPKRLLARAAAVLACLVFLAFFTETELGGNIYVAQDPGTQIVAHRAGGAFAPENTLAALEDSIRAGADMAEIDVQQTRDGELIILHDPNFLRTAGLDQNVWETDLAQVRTLDAGSFFSKDFAGEPIPTLREMLAAAKGRIRLMIELKSTGHEQGLVEQTLEEIRAAGMEEECVIASMDLGLLQQSKLLAPQLETAYISSLAFSEQFDLPGVDGYSIETSFLTLEMVTQLQFDQKKIYAWTANSDRNIQKIIRLGADGLVTDNPRLASFYLASAGKNELAEGLAELLYS